MTDPTLGGFLPRIEPVTEAEQAWMRAQFPAAADGEPDPQEVMARFAGPDVAALPEGRSWTRT
jgi:hypothetical protein